MLFFISELKGEQKEDSVIKTAVILPAASLCLQRVSDEEHPEVDEDHAAGEAKTAPTVHAQFAVAALARLVEQHGAGNYRGTDHEQWIENEEVDAVHGEENNHSGETQANKEIQSGTEERVHKNLGSKFKWIWLSQTNNQVSERKRITELQGSTQRPCR